MQNLKPDDVPNLVHDPLLGPLWDDWEKCAALINQSDTPFARRAYLRAGFALVEGILNWIRSKMQNFVVARGLQTGTIDVARIVLLFDGALRADTQGKIQIEPVRVPFKNNCAFLLRTAADCAQLDPSIFFSDNGWEQMQKALQARHRITHPKDPKDLDIIDEELAAIGAAIEWLTNCFWKIFTSPGVAALRAILGGVRTADLGIETKDD